MVNHDDQYDDDNRRALLSQSGRQSSDADIPAEDKYNERVSANPAVGLRTDSYANRVAQDFMHCKSPDGIDVVFTPGEALPDWARRIQAERLAMPDLDDEVLYGPTVDKAPKKAMRTTVKRLKEGAKSP